jgi:hypothetical protein
MSEQPWEPGKSAVTPNDMPGASSEPVEPAAVDPTESSTETDAPAKKAPPWGSDDEFQPDKAWKLIQNLRAEAEQYKNKAQPILEEHERLRRASQTELEQAREDLDAISAREAAWRAKAVSAEAKSLADVFIDADAALALVGELSDCITDDGVDSDALAERFRQLAERKPHLIKQEPRFTPNRGQGQSGTGHIPVDAQISAAQERGDLITSIALKQAKRYAQ